MFCNGLLLTSLKKYYVVDPVTQTLDLFLDPSDKSLAFYSFAAVQRQVPTENGAWPESKLQQLISLLVTINHVSIYWASNINYKHSATDLLYPNLPIGRKQIISLVLATFQLLIDDQLSTFRYHSATYLTIP